MKTYELWPTKVVVAQIPLEICASLYNTHLQTSSRDYTEIFMENHHAEEYLREQINQHFDGEYEFCEGWIRTLNSGTENNNFELHCDNHYGNQLVAVLQIIGDTNHGGEINLFDPAWRNPKFVSDQTIMDNINSFKLNFIPGQFVIFPADVWHSVNSYYGKNPRVTMNLMVRRIK